jgi:hypothetical protein
LLDRPVLRLLVSNYPNQFHGPSHKTFPAESAEAEGKALSGVDLLAVLLAAGWLMDRDESKWATW